MPFYLLLIEKLKLTYDNGNMSANAFLIVNGIIILLLVTRMFMERKGSKPTALHVDAKMADSGKAVQPEKPLNCFFLYNGHSFDAFEVLGIPAGSDSKACERALIDLQRNNSYPDDFLEAIKTALSFR